MMVWKVFIEVTYLQCLKTHPGEGLPSYPRLYPMLKNQDSNNIGIYLYTPVFNQSPQVMCVPAFEEDWECNAHYI